MKAAIYVRVSTGTQAKGELSIPDQISQCEAYCAAKGWEVIKVFVDAGYSATTDNRPDFQAMMAEARSSYHPFDVIVVHSQSRYSRNMADLLLHEKVLEKAKVSLVSITQDLGDGDAAPMMRQMIGMFDEHQSRETSKHVTRSMAENARQGFWNGAQPPFGYRTYTAEIRGKKEKKKLEIDPAEADIVKLIFEFYVHGDGRSGPFGINRIADYLNQRGYRTRQGRAFSKQFIAKILRNEAYTGDYWFGKTNTKTGEPRPQEEWIKLVIPPIIGAHLFGQVQDKLDRQHPFKTPPRMTTSNVLLTGLATCGACGQPLRLATGKGGKYRYYKCSHRLDRGKAVCGGCSVPESKLDEVVMDALLDKALDPDRLGQVLPSLIERFRNKRAHEAGRIKALKDKRASAKRKLQRLYDLLSDGEIELDPVLKDRLKDLRETIDQMTRQTARLEAGQDTPMTKLSKASIESFAKAVRTRLTTADPQFRKAYLRTLIDEVRVDGQDVTIRGSNAAIAGAAISASDGKKAVLSFDQEWCG